MTGPVPRRDLIVLAVPDFEPDVGGTVRQTGLQARELVRRGYRVVVLTRRRRRDWPSTEHLDGALVFRVGLPGHGRFNEKLSALALFPWLLRWRPRIMVLQTLQWSDAVVAASLVGLLPRTIVGWAARGDAADAADGPDGAVRRRLLARCRHLVLTPRMRDELSALDLPQPAVLPVPVDRRRFRPASAAERQDARRRLGLRDGLVVIYLGHLRELKKVDRLVEAFARLYADMPDAQLLLVGGGRGAVDDADSALRRQVARLGLRRAVVFCGPLDDPVPALHAADVLVLPSMREGQPNSLLEGMACGLACVAPPSAGGDELLTNGAGIVPPTNRPADLLAALRKLADDPKLRAELGRAAAERAAAHDIGPVVDAYEVLFREVAG